MDFDCFSMHTSHSVKGLIRLVLHLQKAKRFILLCKQIFLPCIVRIERWIIYFPNSSSFSIGCRDKCLSFLCFLFTADASTPTGIIDNVISFSVLFVMKLTDLKKNKISWPITKWMLMNQTLSNRNIKVWYLVIYPSIGEFFDWRSDVVVTPLPVSATRAVPANTDWGGTFGTTPYNYRALWLSHPSRCKEGTILHFSTTTSNKRGDESVIKSNAAKWKRITSC